MRQYQIRITELAEEDIENAGDYIAYELKIPSVAESSLKLKIIRGESIWKIICRI